MPDPTPHHVRRVVLPSGKTIEVVLFDGSDLLAPAARRSEEAIHVCRECASPLVHPVDWQGAGEDHWEVDLRCPECGWVGSGIFGQAQLDAFEDELDRGTAELVADLRELARANMAEDIERFAAALAADAVLPEDF